MLQATIRLLLFQFQLFICIVLRFVQEKITTSKTNPSITSKHNNFHILNFFFFNSKIRGDQPFCSEECRQQQIETDEAQERAKTVALIASSRRELQKEEPQSNKGRAGSIELAG